VYLKIRKIHRKGREWRFDPESPTPRFYVEKLAVAQG
jgi:hypothetical protein